MGTEAEGGDALLVGLHVHSAADDNLQEKHRPLRGLLCAALHRVKHAPHLPGQHSSVRRLRVKPSAEGRGWGALGMPEVNAPGVPGITT